MMLKYMLMAALPLLVCNGDTSHSHEHQIGEQNLCILRHMLHAYTHSDNISISNMIELFDSVTTGYHDKAPAHTGEQLPNMVSMDNWWVYDCCIVCECFILSVWLLSLVKVWFHNSLTFLTNRYFPPTQGIRREVAYCAVRSLMGDLETWATKMWRMNEQASFYKMWKKINWQLNNAYCSCYNAREPSRLHIYSLRD